jgi:F-type H+-transporting ATPase subunit delta
MIDSTAAKRYAKSFLLASAAKNIVEEVEEQLLDVKRAYLASADVRAFMIHPRIPRKAKLEAVRRTFQGKVTPIVLAFLQLLVKRSRFNLIPDIADAFDDMADAYRGVIRVRVKTFSPLPDAQRRALEGQISRIVRGQKIDLQVEQDPALLGGLWVKIGDTLIDGSVANKLKTLRERLFDVTLA